MRLSTLVLAMTVATAGACGDDGGADTEGSGTTEDTTSSSGSADTTLGGTGTSTSDSGGLTGSTSVADSSSSGSSSSTGSAESTSLSSSGSGSDSSSSSTGGGMASLDATMSGLGLFQDCMPIVAPDPLGVTFNLALTNTGDIPATATVVSAEIVDGDAVVVGTFEVTPTDFGPVPVGESSMDVVTKTPDSLMPAEGCGVALCNQTYTVELTLDVDGTDVVASAMSPVSCSF